MLRDKIIAECEWAISQIDSGKSVSVIETRSFFECLLRQMKPEPVEPKIYPETRYTGPTIACGACRHEFSAEKPKYCPYCGVPVKGDG